MLVVGAFLALVVVARPSSACADARGSPQSFLSSSHDEPPLHLPKEAVDETVFDNCFLAGTSVETASRGGVNVEDVRVGDRIAPPPGHSCDDPRCGEVVRLFPGQTDQVVTIRAVSRPRAREHRSAARDGGEAGSEDGEPPSAGSSQTIRCTPGHPFFVLGRGYVFAGDLRAGDEFEARGVPVVVTSVEVRAERAQTFNFEVACHHTYRVSGQAGQPAVLVHNISRFRRMWTAYRNAGGTLTKKQYAQRFNAAQRSRTLPGEGAYRDVGGHHVHAHSGFRGHVSYNRHQGFSISQSYMHGRGWDHAAMSARQQQLFRQLGASGKANTLAEHSRIAQEALMAGGATANEARRLVRMSLRDLSAQGVSSPTRIPWFSP